MFKNDTINLKIIFIAKIIKGGNYMTAQVKESINIDLLNKIDIRVGTIKLVEDVEKSDKLVKLSVDFGEFTRTILVGMKGERDNPKEIEGQQALFVVNLAPKKMAGEISEGMLFDIGYADDIVPVLAQPEKPVQNGTRVG
ncbi:tRNA-binding protein [Romboutsia lituseburensis]|uniref:tRNA-binding protein n=1 Tax=Romboutsia lituseburensis TaxID=1537 RepID=UPI00215B0345|nr:tRNA-binding protein [Romboutsia lituseburensis]